MEVSNKLLFCAKTIKAFAAIDANVHDEDIDVSAKVVQDMYLIPAICEALFDKLMEVSCSESVNTPYETLLNTYVLPVVAWGVRADIEPQLHNKIRNAGLARVADERIFNVSQNEMKENMLRYENRMKTYLDKLVSYLQAHRANFPEWSGCSGKCACDDGGKSAGGDKIIAGIYIDRP